MPICKKCLEDKESSDFYDAWNKRSGLRAKCKACTRSETNTASALERSLNPRPRQRQVTTRHQRTRALLTKIEFPSGDGCWRWIGSKRTHGYGGIRVGGRIRAAHRVLYEDILGPIPDGLFLDHLCRNKWCVNPLHLEPVDTKTNTLRGIGPTAVNARKTHCKYGHPLEPKHWFRYCRTCAHANHKRWAESKRGRDYFAKKARQKSA